MGKLKTKTKKDLYRHFLLRMAERYEMHITPNELDQIHSQIKKGKATFIGRQSANITVWQVILRDTPVFVVYNKNYSHVATALTSEQISNENGIAQERMSLYA